MPYRQLGRARQEPTPPRGSDVYIVSFQSHTRAADALAKQLNTGPQGSDGGHVLLLAHAQGADWDYCVIQHSGHGAVRPYPWRRAPSRASAGAPHRHVWSGPSWEEFSKQMAVNAASGVVVLGITAVPGHRATS